jgi:hypothetical protein
MDAGGFSTGKIDENICDYCDKKVSVKHNIYAGRL